MLSHGLLWRWSEVHESCWGQNQAGFRFENPKVSQGRKLTETVQHQPGWKVKKFLGWTKNEARHKPKRVTIVLQSMKEILTRATVLILGYTFWIHRTKGWLRLEGTGHLELIWSKPLFKQGHPEPALLRTVSRQLSSISKGAECPASLCSLCQFSVTFTAKTHFLVHYQLL